MVKDVALKFSYDGINQLFYVHSGDNSFCCYNLETRATTVLATGSTFVDTCFYKGKVQTIDAGRER